MMNPTKDPLVRTAALFQTRFKDQLLCVDAWL